MHPASAPDGLPVFRFHPNAYGLGIFEAVPGICQACNAERTMRYNSSFYAVDDVTHICPWCVADGTAARVFDGEFSDYSGIDGTTPPPTVDLTEAIEVATRTPSYPSWQQEEWRSHCGRPCAYLGGIGSSELTAFLDEPAFAADVHGGLGWDTELILTRLTRDGDLAGYLFECLTCGAHRLHVDAS